MSVAEQVRAVSVELPKARLGSFTAKVKASSKKFPTARAFNNWHANNDVGVGSDCPWGTTN